LGPWPKRSVCSGIGVLPRGSEAERLANQRFVQSRLQDNIGLGKEINQFGDAPTDIAQVADKSEVRRQADPRLDPARQEAIAKSTTRLMEVGSWGRSSIATR